MYNYRRLLGNIYTAVSKTVNEAYLSKEQYNRRQENASRRNMSNIEIAIENGMEEETAELIFDLCSVRHEIHSAIGHLVIDSTYNGLIRKLVLIYSALAEHGLYIETMFLDESGCDIGDIDCMHEVDVYAPKHGTEDYMQWYDNTYEELYGMYEKLNNDIENFLNLIDLKYHTKFCPMGAQRIF